MEGVFPLIYIVCYTLSLYFAYMASHSKRRDNIIFYSILSIMIPCLVGGLRARSVGTDTGGYGYGDALVALRSENLADFMINYVPIREPGYKFVCYIFANAFMHPNGALFAYQVITVTCMYIGCYRFRKITPFPITLMIYYLIQYQHSYNQMRQSLAEAIIFAGFYCLRNKNYKKFLAYVFAAALFHYSALVTVVIIMGVYWFTIRVNSSLHSERRASLIPYWIIGAMFLIQPLILAVVEQLTFLPPQYRGLFASINTLAIFRANIFQQIGVAIMLFYYNKRGKKLFPAKWENEYYKVNALLCCAMYTVAGGYTMWRLLDYLDYTNMFALASIHRLAKDKYVKALILAVVLSISIFYWYREYMMPRGPLGITSSMTWPYKSVLSN